MCARGSVRYNISPGKAAKGHSAFRRGHSQDTHAQATCGAQAQPDDVAPLAI